MLLDRNYYKKNEKLGYYFPMFMMLCFSGNPLITAHKFSNIALITYTLLFFIFIILQKKFRINKTLFRNFILIIVIISLISIGQILSLSFISYPGIFATLLKITLAFSTYLYYNDIRKDFLDVYIRVLSLLSVISFLFFAINFFCFIGISFDNEVIKSVILYTFHDLPLHEHRNFGMFWEPGAYSGYLIIGLIFIIIKNRGFVVGKYKNKIIILFLALITTLSTTGYIILGIIIFTYIFYLKNRLKFMILPIALILFFVTYYSLSFMNEKIDSQFITAVEMSSNDISNTRFGALKMDLQYIKAEPIFGNGLHVQTRYRFHPWIKGDIGHGNGMSNFIACWGFPLFLYWLYCVFSYYRTNTKSKYISLLLLLFTILVLQGEQFLNYPLFLLFFILPNYKKNITTVPLRTEQTLIIS